MPSLAFGLLIAMLLALWAAGGASRADMLGQPLVRGVTCGLLLIASVAGLPRPSDQAKPALWILIAMAGIATLQLIPLPPAIWQTLPARAPFVEAAVAANFSQPWRPWSLTPAATFNALCSLIVPLAILWFTSRVTEQERVALPGVLLGFATLALLPGLLQLSDAGFYNPLIHQHPDGEVRSIFANRNHFALFLAMSCGIAPVWSCLNPRRILLRTIVSAALTVLFLLMILGTGSRAGLLVGILGVVSGQAITWRRTWDSLRQAPRWVRIGLPSVMLASCGVLLFISVVNGRAASISRVLDMAASQDFRLKAAPTIVEMVRIYFPMGSGLGGFDTLFRMHEPFSLLKLTYFNHAHNDYLEIALDAGLPGILLLTAGISWSLFATLRAWQVRSGNLSYLAKLGSVLIFLTLVSSLFDYPARTPIIMAMLAIAATWLGQPAPTERQSALPPDGQTL